MEKAPTQKNSSFFGSLFSKSEKAHTQKNSSFFGRSFSKNEKAQLAISFNWIFVIVVGAVFLTFFFSLISSQSKSSDQKVSATIAKQFETILGTTSQKAGTFKTYRTSPIELNFYCDEKQAISYYAVKDLPAGYTTHEVLFSPSQIKGTTMFTWTQDWSYPYSIMNFLYVTNKFQMFVFYDPGGFGSFKVDKLNQQIPQNLTIYMMNKTHYPEPIMNNDLYTYVFFDDQLADIDSFFGSEKIITEKSQIVIIKPESTDIFETGIVYFTTGLEYEEELILNGNLDTFESSPYFGAASLFGAIFAGEKQNYDCNMDKAFRRLLMLNKLHQYRLDAALPDISPVSNCYFLYNGSSVVPDGLRQVLGNFSEILELGFSQVDETEFNKIVRTIEDKNSRVSFESKCPGLY